MNTTHYLNDFEKALLAINQNAAQKIIEKILADHMDITVCMDRIITPVLQRIGNGWEQGDVALSQVYMSGRICEELVNHFLPPAMAENGAPPDMAIVVLDDFHMLGKRIVYSVLRSSGFALLDFGRQDVDNLVEKIHEHGIRILLISTLMLSAAYRVEELRNRLEQSGIQIRIIVGGAPFLFNKQLWSDVGADAMGYNAAESIEIVRRFSGGAA